MKDEKDAIRVNHKAQLTSHPRLTTVISYATVAIGQSLVATSKLHYRHSSYPGRARRDLCQRDACIRCGQRRSSVPHIPRIEGELR